MSRKSTTSSSDGAKRKPKSASSQSTDQSLMKSVPLDYPGAKVVKSLQEIGHLSLSTKVLERHYTVIYRAYLSTVGRLESSIGDKIIRCKEIKLNRTSPRYKANLLKNSTRIHRYLCAGDPSITMIINVPSTATTGTYHKCHRVCDYFDLVYDIYQVGQSVYIFMDEHCGETMHDRVHLPNKPPIKSEEVQEWTRQLVEAVDHLHKFGVAHRCIKLQHVMLPNRVNLTSWSKCVPFSDPTDNCPLYQHRERRSRKNRHLPPECFSLAQYDPSKVDLWSVGVITVALTTKRYPFNPHCSAKFSAQWKQFIERHLSKHDKVRDFCNKVFYLDYSKRLSPNQLLKDRYLRKDKPKSKSDSRSSSKSDSSSTSVTSSRDKSNRSSSQSSTKSDRPSKSTSSSSSRSELDQIDPGETKATGDEGGAVGESLPQAEKDYESFDQVAASTEEQENKAEPIRVAITTAGASVTKSKSKKTK